MNRTHLLISTATKLISQLPCFFQMNGNPQVNTPVKCHKVLNSVLLHHRFLPQTGQTRNHDSDFGRFVFWKTWRHFTTVSDAKSKCTQISFMQKIQASNLYLYCLWWWRMRISLVLASKLHSTEDSGNCPVLHYSQVRLYMQQCPLRIT